jgi:D-alanyl-D-alanine carboxypeptidase
MTVCVARSCRGLAALALALLVWLPLPATAAQKAALVLDAATGEVLYADNIDTPVYPASLTKIMTLFMVFEALDAGTLTLDQELRVSAHAAAQPPSRLGLDPGDHITVENAILALVTKSANDIAVVVAEALGGSEAQFAAAMTQRARALGLTGSVFVNASGLPDERQLTTARDMANLALAIRARFPHYYHYFATAEFNYHGHSYENHNKLLGQYDGTDGLKTGYIAASGYNLVASVERDGRRLIGVVFGGTSPNQRNSYMMELFDEGYAMQSEAPPHPPLRAADEALLVAANPARQTELALYGGAAAPAMGDSDDTAALLAMLRPPMEPIPLDPTAMYIAPGGVRGMVPLAATPVPTVEFTAAPIPPSSAFSLGSRWGVQVGAYSNEIAARAAAERAQAQSPNWLAAAEIALPPVQVGNQVLYRAWIVGLAREAASEACYELHQVQLDCIALSPF